MQNLKILGRKERKNFLGVLKKQFGFEDKLDYTMLMNNKNKVFIVNKEIADLGLDRLSRLRVNSIGMYIAELRADEARLSIEGSQLIGPKAKRNVVELNEKEAREWMRGRDIEKEFKKRNGTEFKKRDEMKGFVILKCGSDYLGSGRVKEGSILNFVPKTRRLNVSD